MRLKENKAITLIALIITIVIMLILAIVTIAAVKGEGIIGKAKQAKADYQNAQSEEQNIIDQYLAEMEGFVDDNSVGGNNTISEEQTENIPEVITHYTAEEIEASEYLYGIGKTDLTYVVAAFNEEYTEVVITKNGEESDGVIMEFAPWTLMMNSPMYDKRDTLKKAIIKQGVTNTGSADAGGNIFGNCTNLINVEIPNSVTTLGKNSFNGCTGLTSIIIPNSVTTIGYGAFINCISLKSVEIPNSVTIIDGDTFIGCTGLTKITIPNSVTTIATRAFSGCTNLINIEFSSTVFNIDEDVFDNTAWYNSQPDGLIYIDKGVYKYKGTCPETVIIAEGTESIYGGAFKHAKNLTNVTIPNGVESICSSAFYGCTNLNNVIIPSSVTTVGSAAFYSCATNVFIPSSVTKIDNNAFFMGQNSTIYCETQDVADLLIDGTNYYSPNTTVVVDPSKF